MFSCFHVRPRPRTCRTQETDLLAQKSQTCFCLTRLPSLPHSGTSVFYHVQPFSARPFAGVVMNVLSSSGNTEPETDFDVSHIKGASSLYSLRTQYGRYKKVAPSAGSAARKTGRQRWILTRLQFLEPSLRRTETTSNHTVSKPHCFFHLHV